MGLLKGSCRQPSGGDWRACACAQHSDSFTYRHFRQGRDIFLLLSPPPQASRCLSSEAPFRLGRPGTFCLLKAAFPNAEGQSTRRGMDVKRREVDQQEHDVISKKKAPGFQNRVLVSAQTRLKRAAPRGTPTRCFGCTERRWPSAFLP